MTYGVDVSENNGRVDWNAVAEAGQKFAIVRSSYGRYAKDEDFLRNVDGAHAAGLQCGAYHYSYAFTPEQARQEARNCKDVIDRAGVLLELPVWFDMEDADFYKLRKNRNFYNRNLISSICQAFCRKTASAGYHTGIYASYSWFKEFISGCDQYEKWVAHWGSNESKYEQTSEDAAMELKAAILQYACKPLDRNVMYIDPAKLDD
jgi:GH25 family lysozyme M1 (1,4-beta-N-acetylmuramidase)